MNEELSVVYNIVDESESRCKLTIEGKGDFYFNKDSEQAVETLLQELETIKSQHKDVAQKLRSLLIAVGNISNKNNT